MIANDAIRRVLSSRRSNANDRRSSSSRSGGQGRKVAGCYLLERQTRSSFVDTMGWIRCGEEGRLGLAARTFTCLDHSAGTMASAKQPAVTRDQIKDTIYPPLPLCSTLLTCFRVFFLTPCLLRWHGIAKTCLETNT